MVHEAWRSFAARPRRTADGDLSMVLMSATCAFIPRRHFLPFLSKNSELPPLLLTSARRAPRPYKGLSHRKRGGAMPERCGCGRRSWRARIARDDRARRPPRNEPGAAWDRSCTARRVRAQQFIEQRCIDPRLDAERVAEHLGISLRTLHLAFEPTGASVGSRILSARLRRACDLLVRFPKRSVLDIALDCGFENLATFYRGFSRAYGRPPGEARKDLR